MNKSKTDIPIQKSGEGKITGRFMFGWHRMRAGIITPLEFVLMCIDKGIEVVTKCDPQMGDYLMAHRIIKKLRSSGNVEKDYYSFRDAKIPLLEGKRKADFFSDAMLDVYYCYMNLNDCYEEKEINDYFYILPEGPYCLHNESVDVRVNAGDVVIDAGSWIGDFAAYASAKGATCYAFEMLDENYEILTRTAGLNSGIIPVKKALGNFSENVSVSGDSLTAAISEDSNGGAVQTTIDDFVRENNLSRVDFIKSDIEGFERHLLEGAQETLAHFAPKLAICTYHLPDDPEVLSGLIKKANPKYNIVQKRKKLFASVPQE